VRAVADTNTVVSGLLWQGAPRQVLDAARAGKVDLCTSAALLAELEDVLRRDKFAERLQRASVTAHGLTIGYAGLVEPAAITPVILEDPDDDAVLACAIAAQAEIIVSVGRGVGKLERLELRLHLFEGRAREIVLHPAGIGALGSRQREPQRIPLRDFHRRLNRLRQRGLRQRLQQRGRCTRLLGQRVLAEQPERRDALR